MEQVNYFCYNIEEKFVVMKLKLIAITFFLFALGACTQKTCPTYTKDNVKETQKVEQNV